MRWRDDSTERDRLYKRQWGERKMERTLKVNRGRVKDEHENKRASCPGTVAYWVPWKGRSQRHAKHNNSGICVKLSGMGDLEQCSPKYKHLNR